MMQVVRVPDVDMPSGHDWLLVERGECLTAYVAESMGAESMAEVARAAGRCRRAA